MASLVWIMILPTSRKTLAIQKAKARRLRNLLRSHAGRIQTHRSKKTINAHFFKYHHMQKTLVLNDQTAKELYKTGSPELKAILEESFGKKTFISKITDAISSWEHVCRINGIDPSDVRFHEGEPDEIAYRKLKEITKAYNQGWKPDWNDGNQQKWFAWWYMDSPGFRLDGIDYVWTGSYAGSGSRLCFSSQENAQHAAGLFKDIYKTFITTPDDQN